MDETFRYKTNNYSLHIVLRQIETGRMVLDPEFKDLRTPTSKEKSLFIESLILGIPTQPFWCEESPSGDFIVLEGSERLKTLVEFFNGNFPLTTLKIRKEYGGLYFKDLPYHEKLSIEDRQLFTFIIINYDTAAQLKCEFFRRILSYTGNSSDQSARNFAWRGSFDFLQDIKVSCENLVEFTSRDSRRNLQIDSAKVRSAIDEVFLYLLMISSILHGDLFENAYLDHSFSIDDLLDWTMRYFDEKVEKRRDAREKIISALIGINKYLGRAPKVLLSNTSGSHFADSNNVSLPQFYLFFVKASATELNKSINWGSVKAQGFSNSVRAQKLISYIFQARDD